MGSKNTKNKKISITNEDINVKTDQQNINNNTNSNKTTTCDTGLYHATTTTPNDKRRPSNGSASSQNSNGGGVGGKAQPTTQQANGWSDQEDHDYPPMSPAIISTTHLNDTKPDPNAVNTTSTRIIYVNSVRHSSLPAYPLDTLLYNSNHDKENADPDNNNNNSNVSAAPRRLVPILVNNNHGNEVKGGGKILSNGKEGGGGGLRMLPIIARRRSVATTKILQKEQIETTDLEASANRPARTAKGVRFSEQVITIDHSPFQQPDLDDTQLSNDDCLYPNEHYMRRRSSLKEGHLLKKPVAEPIDELGETNNTTSTTTDQISSKNTTAPATTTRSTSTTINVKSKPLSFN